MERVTQDGMEGDESAWLVRAGLPEQVRSELEGGRGRGSSPARIHQRVPDLRVMSKWGAEGVSHGVGRAQQMGDHVGCESKFGFYSQRNKETLEFVVYKLVSSMVT